MWESTVDTLFLFLKKKHNEDLLHLIVAFILNNFFVFWGGEETH